MPDLFMRMSASSKAVSLGVGLLLIALAVHFQNKDVTAKAALVIAFFLLKAPVAAHVLARAAYRIGVSLWEETQVDELRDYYDQPPPFPETGEAVKEHEEA
jgi:multicomponent Na+:H+ antiporter subunit G